MTQIGREMGRRLRIARLAVGENNAADLSRRLGLSGSNVWGNWEARGTVPNVHVINKFIDLYPSLSTDYIYRGDKSRLAHGVVQAIEEAEARVADDDKNPVKRGRRKRDQSGHDTPAPTAAHTPRSRA